MVKSKRLTWVKRYSALRKSYKEGAIGRSLLNMTTEFPVYTPSGAGDYQTRASLTKLAINQSVENLRDLAVAFGKASTREVDAEQFATSPDALQIADEIKGRLDHYGSDKGQLNSYHLIYGRIFADLAEIRSLLEIGLGTNNTDVFSHMGKRGNPGASLRAFRDHFPNAMIYGADVDKRILFEEERIKTFFVDQTDPDTLSSVGNEIPGSLDLMIDDGLHAVNANLASLHFGLQKIRVGGWVVIEDITYESKPIWEVVSRILTESYEVHLIRTPRAYVFAVKRLA
ncbi:hypothetical protein [Hoeflea sp. TYP-13]|uniref:hypothetical protein n=1 Tax=Hoeflea sp. TYP-13 TaxID=3230023 RepID=UPI0034C69227